MLWNKHSLNATTHNTQNLTIKLKPSTDFIMVANDHVYSFTHQRFAIYYLLYRYTAVEDQAMVPPPVEANRYQHRVIQSLTRGTYTSHITTQHSLIKIVASYTFKSLQWWGTLSCKLAPSTLLSRSTSTFATQLFAPRTDRRVVVYSL